MRRPDFVFVSSLSHHFRGHLCSGFVEVVIHAQLRREPPSMSLDLFYEKYQLSRGIGAGLFGTVHYVRRKESYNYFAAKFLDPNAHTYGSDSKELRILEALDHDCVIKLVEVYQPYFPAPSRDFPNPSQIRKERKELVLVFPV